MLSASRLFPAAFYFPSRLALIAVGVLASLNLATAQRLPQLAPGVLQLVPSAPEEEDTVSGPSPLDELVQMSPDWQPHFAPQNETLAAIANQITLRRTVWQLEFAYKPMRMITINVGGVTKRVWYLVYRVTNTGRHLKPTPTADEYGHDKYGVSLVSKPVRFTPTFHLVAYETGTRYADQVIPAAVSAIHKIEIRDPSIPLYDSVSISSQPLKASSEAEDHSVWGVATWTDVDPTIDFFSVFVQGLSNAYEWNPDAEGEQRFLFKTLQLNFWRPGDAVLEHQDEFRVGLPYVEDPTERAEVLTMYGLEDVQEYVWVYRP